MRCAGSTGLAVRINIDPTFNGLKKLAGQIVGSPVEAVVAINFRRRFCPISAARINRIRHRKSEVQLLNLLSTVCRLAVRHAHGYWRQPPQDNRRPTESGTQPVPVWTTGAAGKSHSIVGQQGT